jgi:uncharacterized protein YjbI with pentapeptide repeats
MDIIKRTQGLPFYSRDELSIALGELEKHGQVNACNNNKVFEIAIGATYSGDYTRKSLKRSNLTQCKFIEADFTRVAATGSKFLKSDFIDCNINGANFQYCDFSGSSIRTENKKIILEGSNFSESIFSDSKLHDLAIVACSFSQVLFYKSIIKNCNIKSTTFENSTFINCTFENIELRNLNLEYAEFKNVKMKNVVLPFSQMPYTFGGLKYLFETNDNVFLSSKKNQEEKITIDEYKKSLIYLEKYYLSINEFFPLTNIYLAQKKLDYAYQSIISGLVYSVQNKDFRMLKFFCRLASISDCFSSKQLLELYNKIHEIIPAEHLYISELHNYEIHIGEIRTLLLNNKVNKLSAQINIKTNIENQNSIDLGYLIKVLNETIRLSNDNLKWDMIEIRHNSPYELFLQISSSDYTFIISSIVFVYTVLMKSNKLYQEFCNTALKHLDVKKKVFENKELKNLKEELEKRNIKINDARHHISGTDFFSNTSIDNKLIHFHLKE